MLADEASAAGSKSHLKYRAFWKIPGRAGKLEGPHIVAIKRIDHGDPIGISQLGRASIEPLILLIPMCAADPIPDLESPFVCGMAGAEREKAHRPNHYQAEAAHHLLTTLPRHDSSQKPER